MDSQRRESRIEDLVIRFHFVSALSLGFKECRVVICDHPDIHKDYDDGGDYQIKPAELIVSSL